MDTLEPCSKNVSAHLWDQGVKQSNHAVSTCGKKKMFLAIPFIGQQSTTLRKELKNILERYFAYIDFELIQSNKFTLASLFRYKDRLPKELTSGIVYKYSCAKCQLASYIGYTTRSLKIRMFEHKGRSYRSFQPLSSPSHSAIRDHAEGCDCFIEMDDFKILASSNDELELKILESLHIYKSDPVLNRMMTSMPLKIVKWRHYQPCTIDRVYIISILKIFIELLQSSFKFLVRSMNW